MKNMDLDREALQLIQCLQPPCYWKTLESGKGGTCYLKIPRKYMIPEEIKKIYMFNKSCMKEQEIRTANLIMAEGKRSHWSF